ncbi:MAG: TIGR01212 family radical SAM protein [Clostridium sp.]
MNTMIEKPYYALDYYLKQTFGEKIYKLALDGGMNCPNRDGTLGFGGCIFCSHGGSGDFAEPMRTSVTDQIERAKERVSHKIKQGRYIAYFQSYTNTYAPVSYLEPLFSEAIAHPDIVALSIGTRPDCLPPDVIELLSKLNKQKPVWIELGLQTIHETTAKTICRGYELPCFEDAVIRLKKAGIDVIVHVILGLPGESRENMLDTIRYLSRLNPPIDGIKLQLLHILKDTKLAALYEAASFPILSMNEYIDLVLDCIRLLPPDVVIHRLSGDGPKNLLIEPLWSGNKRLVLNSITKAFKDTGAYQGEYFNGLKG